MRTQCLSCVSHMRRKAPTRLGVATVPCQEKNPNLFWPGTEWPRRAANADQRAVIGEIANAQDQRPARAQSAKLSRLVVLPRSLVPFACTARRKTKLGHVVNGTYCAWTMRRLVIPILAPASAATIFGVAAHDGLGIPIDTIRTDALTSAGFIFILVACGSLLR